MKKIKCPLCGKPAAVTAVGEEGVPLDVSLAAKKLFKTTGSHTLTVWWQCEAGHSLTATVHKPTKAMLAAARAAVA